MKLPYLIVATIGVAFYLVIFLAAPFEPYEVLIQKTVPRGMFFSYLLLPEAFFSEWTGPAGEISLRDRVPILFFTSLFLLAAAGFGNLFFSVSGLGQRLSRLEYWIFSLVFGLAFISILLFWLYFLHGGFARETSRRVSVGLLIAGVVSAAGCEWFRRKEKSAREPWSRMKKTAFFIVLPVFTLLLILGGMTPSTEYDVLAYHLAGAREFVKEGGIVFLPDDVYSNMPFGAEMFAVWGMGLADDFFIGALIGKTVIAATSVLTALGLYALGRRFFSETVGLIAMILSISTPWILNVSTVGLIDSVVGMYALFTLYAVFLFQQPVFPADGSDDVAEDRSDWKTAFLSGFLAGAAAACKYPAMLFVVAPVGLWFLSVALFSKRKRFFSGAVPLLLFSLAVLAACGGWYFKNAWFTGNPVYPLCYSLFGDSTGSWTPEIDARWTRVHSPHGFGPARLFGDLSRIVLASPWNAPLTIPFCLLIVFAWKTFDKGQRRIITLSASWLLFLFASWWLLTHRIDRFWVPGIPMLTLLAAVGAGWSDHRSWKFILSLFLTVSLIYCFLMGGIGAPGKSNQYLAPLETIRHRTPWASWFNANPPEGTVLLVGEAKAFLYDVPVLYSSCFNETPLKEIVSEEDPAAAFRRRGISHVLVDWSEIERFRSPGNYGFSEIVRRELFDDLVARGILERFVPNDELAEIPTVVYRVVD